MDLPEPPDIYFPHELTDQTLRLRNKVVLYVSMANQGAAEAAQELHEAYSDKNLTIISRPRSLLLPKRRRSSVQQELRRTVSNLAFITRRSSEDRFRIPSAVGEGPGLEGSNGSNRRSCSRGSSSSSCNRGNVGRSERSRMPSCSSAEDGRNSLRCLNRLRDFSGAQRVSREPSQDSIADEDWGESPEGESRRDSAVQSNTLSTPPKAQYEEPNPNLSTRSKRRSLSVRSARDSLRTAAQTLKQAVVPDKNGQVAFAGRLSTIVASGMAQAVKALEQSDTNEPVQNYATHSARTMPSSSHSPHALPPPSCRLIPASVV